MLPSGYGINVCLACDNNYAVHAGVVIASILKNATAEDALNFYILDGGISELNKTKIQSLKSIKDCNIYFIEINEKDFEDYKKIKTHEYITIATYYRLKLPTLLPEVKRIIYFDCDVVVNASLKELFNTEMQDFPIAGVNDIKKKLVKKNPTYVNAGMLIFDLENMREQNLENKFLKWAQENVASIKCGDQEIINEVCKGNIKIVDKEWNVQSSNFTNRSSYTNFPKCIHFVARKKPWHFGSFSYHKHYYFEYLQLTPWALSEEDEKYWTKKNQIASLFNYILYRPLFAIRPRFYKALFYTYIKPLLKGVNK